MKYICICFALAVSTCLSFADEMPTNGLTIRSVQARESGIIELEIINSSKEKIRVWQESNSWGSAHWRVLVLRNNGLLLYFQNPRQRFTVNAPRFNELLPGQHLSQNLNLNGGNWCDTEYCSQYDESGIGGKAVEFKKGDIVIVIYDVPFTYNSAIQRLKIWYGTVAVTTGVQ
jgi:hypothetical protein